MGDENVDLRISKFWSDIKTLIREGIRFCHPQKMKQLFNSLAVSTLKYGLELCSITPTLLQKLDTIGIKALKSLFNISVFSKNYLNTLNVEHISTRIVKNKFGLLTRLLHSNNTVASIMRMLEINDSNGSFENVGYPIGYPN